MNEDSESRSSQHDRGHGPWPRQAVSESHKDRYRPNVTASFLESPRPQVVPSYVLEDEKAGHKDREEQEANRRWHFRPESIETRRVVSFRQVL